MKTLYLIGGPMGVGKTTVCRLLKKELDRAVFLDGDWCWDADPFVVNDETKAMVLDNICHVLNNFLSCTAYENIICCWVMHEQEIIDAIQSALRLQDCRVITISLVCRRDVLVSRLEKDICGGLRQPDVIGRSLDRLTCYAGLDTLKLDVSDQTPEQAVRLIAKL